MQVGSVCAAVGSEDRVFTTRTCLHACLHERCVCHIGATALCIFNFTKLVGSAAHKLTCERKLKRPLAHKPLTLHTLMPQVSVHVCVCDCTCVRVNTCTRACACTCMFALSVMCASLRTRTRTCTRCLCNTQHTYANARVSKDSGAHLAHEGYSQHFLSLFPFPLQTARVTTCDT